MEMNKIFKVDGNTKAIALTPRDAAKLLIHCGRMDIVEYVDESGMEHGWHGVELIKKFDQDIVIAGYFGGDHGIHAHNVDELADEHGGRVEGLAEFLDKYTWDTYENRDKEAVIICEVPKRARTWVVDNLVKLPGDID